MGRLSTTGSSPWALRTSSTSPGTTPLLAATSAPDFSPLVFLELNGISIAHGSQALYDLTLGVAEGCVTKAGATETLRRMHEAIELHLEGLREDGLAVPKSILSAEYVAVR